MDYGLLNILLPIEIKLKIHDIFEYNYILNLKTDCHNELLKKFEKKGSFVNVHYCCDYCQKYVLVCRQCSGEWSLHGNEGHYCSLLRLHRLNVTF